MGTARESQEEGVSRELKNNSKCEALSPGRDEKREQEREKGTHY